MTTKLSSGRARFRRSTAALGIAGLALAGLAGPALADVADPEEPTSEDSDSSDPDSKGEEPSPELTEEDDAEEEGNDSKADPADSNGGDGDVGEEGDEGSEQATEAEPSIGTFALNTTLTVDLVGINDFHGRIDADRKVDEGTTIVESAAVRLASAVQDARNADEDTLFVGAGDLYGASTFTSMAGDDNPTIEVLNEIGLDVSSVGNHEFDQSYATLMDRINGEDGYVEVEWPYLGANVYHEGTDDAALDEYDVHTVNGADIAFIGLVTQETPFLVTPAGVAGLEFGDPAEAVERVIDENDLDETTDAIVILTHDGGSNKAAVENTETNFGEFAQAMADRGDIAAIFSGHTHTLYQASVDGMPVIQTGAYGENLGKVTLTFNEDDDGGWNFTSAASDMIPLKWTEGEGDDAVTKYYEALDDAMVNRVRKIVNDAVAEADKIGAEIIGEATADFNRARHTDPESGEFGENRGGESTISNLIADAQLWKVEDQGSAETMPVIAFMNPGGVRTDIEAGDVSYKQAASVQPFANTLETFDLTGAQIKQVLEEQWQPDGVSRPFLKLGLNSEFFYTYDPEAPRNERVTDMFLSGDPIDLDATYRVVANNFLASGGDNFFTLGKGANYSDTGLIDLASFVEYFEAMSPVSPDYRQRAVGVHWESGEDGVHTAGEDVEIHLSSLVFATNEPKSETVIASLTNSESNETIELGEFEVDPEIVNTNDEMGRAIVEFAMPDIEAPEDDSESWILEITDDLGLVSLAWDITVEQDSEETPPPTDEGEDDDGDNGGGAAPGDDMPDTGTDVNGMLITTAILLAVGGTALAVRRRQTMS